MKYYKFIKNYNWEALEEAIEQADNMGVSCDDIENAMFEVMQQTDKPELVDDVNEDIDGLYVDDENIDTCLGEENEYLFAYVVHDGVVLYEFEFNNYL